MTKQPLGKKALFKTVLDVLLEAKNVRISYVYEYELVTWLVTWLHGYKISQRYVENSEFYVLKKKSSIKQYLLNISLLKHDIWQEESMEWALLGLPICIASENRGVGDLKACFVAFKTSIIFRADYSVAFLRFILCPRRSKIIGKERKYWKSAAQTLFFHIWSFLVNASL